MLCLFFHLQVRSLLSLQFAERMLLPQHAGYTLFRLYQDPVDHLLLLQEARSKFRNAQAQIALCKQEFFSAQRAGDYEKQAFCTSQIEYWQQKAVEEKQRAHKKIFSSK